MFGSEKAPFEIKQFGRGVAVKCGSDYIGLRSDRTLGAQVFNTILLYYKILLLLYTTVKDFKNNKLTPGTETAI